MGIFNDDKIVGINGGKIASVVVLIVMLLLVMGCSKKDIEIDKKAIAMEGRYLERIYKILKNNPFIAGIIIDPDLVEVEVELENAEKYDDLTDDSWSLPQKFIYLNNKPALVMSQFGGKYFFLIYTDEYDHRK